ncbi:MAG: UDP-N-acetylmuramoyl-L-alanine--D-glutamate ligase [Thiotrichaceae bacterium]|nr:UDP-N-acetylmuramoyl-L-alanine--D-glutamate ligase [Thiotrichaceae bacterium]
MDKQNNDWEVLVVGLGQTGLSVVHYLAERGIKFAVTDSRKNPPGQDELLSQYSNVPYFFGDFKAAVFKQAKQLVVSPGISVQTPEIQMARDEGAEIVGDIELFVRNVLKPVIAITGSNGKTTVTLLMKSMIEQAGLTVSIGGNIGIPALQTLADDADVYVLELSSFQMETTNSMNAKAAVILNISEDHLDRYDSFESYISAKAKIYDQCQVPVINRDDKIVSALVNTDDVLSFGYGEPLQADDFGIRQHEGSDWLAKGQQLLMPVGEIRMLGRHNTCNALAALALGEQVGLPLNSMCETLRVFAGVEHRCQWVGRYNGVDWYNDSKGTNVGATIAALSGLDGNVILLAGGQSKGADFSDLAKVVKEKDCDVILIGEDAELIAGDLHHSTRFYIVGSSMRCAVQKAAELAKEGSHVLLSPACASFDMFKNYEERGEVFMNEVKELSCEMATKK